MSLSLEGRLGSLVSVPSRFGSVPSDLTGPLPHGAEVFELVTPRSILTEADVDYDGAQAPAERLPPIPATPLPSPRRPWFSSDTPAPGPAPLLGPLATNLAVAGGVACLTWAATRYWRTRATAQDAEAALAGPVGTPLVGTSSGGRSSSSTCSVAATGHTESGGGAAAAAGERCTAAGRSGPPSESGAAAKASSDAASGMRPVRREPTWGRDLAMLGAAAVLACCCGMRLQMWRQSADALRSLALADASRSSSPVGARTVARHALLERLPWYGLFRAQLNTLQEDLHQAQLNVQAKDGELRALTQECGEMRSTVQIAQERASSLQEEVQRTQAGMLQEISRLQDEAEGLRRKKALLRKAYDRKMRSFGGIGGGVGWI